jgi:hypothetical protein
VIPIPVDDHVPESVRRDLQKLIRSVTDKGGDVQLLNVPAEDFGRVIDAAVRTIPHPFTPTLCGIPIAPWEKEHLGVMAKAAPSLPAPTLFTADGREHAVSQE